MSELNRQLEHIRLSGRSLKDPVLAVWVPPPAAVAWNPVKFPPEEQSPEYLLVIHLKKKLELRT